MSVEAINAHIKNLPPLPLVAHKLVTLMQRDDCSASDVTRILCSDQALAGKVLKLANSSFYGLSGQVGSVSRAVVILGFSAIRSVALGLGMAQSVRKAASGMDLGYFWRHALFTAAAARTLAVDNGKVDPEEVFVSGLIHDLGRLILELSVPGLDEQLADVTATDLLNAEQATAGMAHTKAGQQIMRHWRLPDALAQLSRFHHHPTNFKNDDLSLCAFVQLGELMVTVLGQSREPVSDDPDPAALAAHLGISLRTTEDLLARTCQEVTRTRAFLDVAGIDVEVEHPLAHLDIENPAPEDGGAGVYLGTCAERAGWVNGQLGIHGWRSLGMRAFLGGEAGPADLAIVDPRSMSPAQAAKLKPLLAERGARTVLLGSDPEMARTLDQPPSLPTAFTRQQLLALSGRVPA